MRDATVTLLFAAAMFAVGCEKSLPQPSAPRPRTVSYSPALTEMIFDMGLGDHVVGVTTQCILPGGRDRRRLGDALSGNVTEAILAVQPDLVLIQTNRRQFQAVTKANANIAIEHFTIETMDDIPAAMMRIARLLGCPAAGEKAAGRFCDQLRAVEARVAGKARPRVLFLMGYKAPATAGSGTFIDRMITRAGGRNAAAEKFAGWPAINIEHVLAARPDVVVCWVDTRYERADEARRYWLGVPGLPAAAGGRVYAVTERGWTIPTGRLPGYVAKLAELIHPAATDAETTK